MSFVEQQCGKRKPGRTRGRDRYSRALRIEMQRIQAARKDAESEITDALETSNDAAVRHLAGRLKNEKNLPDRQRVQDARTHRGAWRAGSLPGGGREFWQIAVRTRWTL